MYFVGTGFSHKGIVKEQNQDSYLLKIAETDLGDVALAAVADGMGGLSSGELASATAIRALSEWFETKLPLSLEAMDASIGGFESFVEGQWEGLVQDLNLQIMRYGRHKGVSLGTTLTAMLAIGARYSIMHVGDTRVYEITDSYAKQLTKDQTLVQREMDAGRLTLQEAAVHPQRNVLLQCLGASKEVKPQIIHGNLQDDAIYLICSDGFRHVLSEAELTSWLGPAALHGVMDAQTDVQTGSKTAAQTDIQTDAQTDARTGSQTGAQASASQGSNQQSQRVASLKSYLQRLVGLVMERKERDNITVLVLEASKKGGRS